MATLVRAYLLRQKSAFVGRTARSEQDLFPPECGHVIRSGFCLADGPTDKDCAAAFDRQLDGADRQAADITRRLARTDEDVRSRLPIWALVKQTGLAPDLVDAVLTPPDDPNAVPVRQDALALDVLLLALLFDRFPEYRAALAVAPRADGQPHGALTTGVALRILHPRAGRDEFDGSVFDPDGVLRDCELITLTSNDPSGDAAVAIDPWIADILLGRDPPCERGLGHGVGASGAEQQVRDWDAVHAGGLGVDQLRELSVWWWAVDRPPAVVLLQGPRGTPFRTAVEAFLTRPVEQNSDWRYFARFVTVDARAAVRAADWPATVRRVYRTAMMCNRNVLWTGAEAVLTADPGSEKWDVLIRRAEQATVVTFLASDIGWDPVAAFCRPTQVFARIEFGVPTPDTRRKVWKERLLVEKNPIGDEKNSPAHRATLDTLASFQFTEGEIFDALAIARGLAVVQPSAPGGTRRPTAAMLAEACRRQSARRLVSFAQRIQPGSIQLPDAADDRAARRKALGQQVVLARRVAQQLEELLDRMTDQDRVYHGLGFENRLSLGRGLITLFTGPSGTGKTLSATVLAGLLGKDVYKVDVAAVVSQFVGVTEKNLSQVFADAQGANAVLFFDEADALFGKRGDVERAQDRWANLEVNFLLQRVEEYTGTVILATNLPKNIDDAFARRIQVVVEFPKPEAAERLQILKGMLAGAPSSVTFQTDSGAVTGQDPGVDAVLDPIARRFDLTGGNLKNVVLDAVFRAVSRTPEDEPVVVTADDFLLGVAREYLKEGRTLTPGEFGRDRLKMIEEKLKLGLDPE